MSHLKRVLTSAPSRMAALSNGLVLPAEPRPPQTERRVCHGFAQRQEQATHLGHRQGKQA